MALHYEKHQTLIGFGTEKKNKFVGRRRLADPFTLERLSKEIAHETGMRQATCETVLRYMVLAVEDAIQDGRSVDIGIGTVSPTISTVAADTAEEVKVRKKRILFRPSKKLRTIVENMKVRLIADESDDLDDADDDLDGGSTDNSGSTESGSNGAEGTEGNGGSDSGTTPSAPATGPFTITAVVGSDGGGTVSIKKNGQTISGSSVQATSSDTVVIEAVPENDNFQFMSWSDGSSQTPRTIQPSADMNLEASFMDLSKI